MSSTEIWAHTCWGRATTNIEVIGRFLATTIEVGRVSDTAVEVTVRG